MSAINPHRTCSNLRLRPTMALVFAWVAAAATSAGGENEGYTNVRFPRYDAGSGVLASEIEATSADTLGQSVRATRITLRGVTIRVYELPRPGKQPAPGRPPLKVIITSRRGRYERIGAGKRASEDLAYLEGDVHLVRYAVLPGGKRAIDTEIFCDNATWDRCRQILNSTGPVLIKQPGSRLRGRNLYYKMKGRDNAIVTGPDPRIPGAARNKYGGEVVVRGPVKMVTVKSMRPVAPAAGRTVSDRGGASRATPPPARAQPTVVTCSGVAIYNLDRAMVQFQENVKVKRSNMDIAGDFLRVLMARGRQEIREMIAWSNVRITGRSAQPGGGGKERVSYLARGGYAHYTLSDGKLYLRDSGQGRNPDVLVGEDRLIDKEIRFTTRDGQLQRLTTSGGSGDALLHRVERPVTTGAGAQAADQAAATRVRYRGTAVYEAAQDLVVFTRKVNLTQGELRLDADKLSVYFTPRRQESAGDTRGVRKLVAAGHVIIRRAGVDATATRAELVRDRNLLILTGPPHPQVERPGAYRLIAPHIEVVQLPVPAGQRARVIITGSGGPGSFVFLPQKQAAPDRAAKSGGDIAIRDKAIRIRYDGSMHYNEGELPLRVRFRKNVVADTAAYVLRSDELEVVLAREQHRADAREARAARVKRIIATGNATLHSGLRHFKAHRIVRDVPQAVVTLYGRDASRPGMPRSEAEVWEERGARFRAPRITAMERGGDMADTIHAQGPGRIVMPDGDKGQKAIVTYAGTADYREFPNRAGKVVLRQNVVMVRQSSGMIVRGETMDAYLEESATPGEERSDPTAKTRLPRRLRRVVMREKVVVTQGERTAYGSVGDLVIRPVGDIVTMTGSKAAPAQVVDQAGMRLYAPRLVVTQATGIVTATGPGKVYVTSTEPLKHVNPRVAARSKSHEVNYLILYEREVKYNSLARKVKFRKNVRLRQKNLQARCERLVLLLEDLPEAEGHVRSNQSAFKVKSVEAFDRVCFRRFEPARFQSETRVAPLDRVGRTVYTKSQRAFYDVDANIVKLFGSPPDPQAIQQTNTINDEGQLKRSRVKASASKYILLNVETGDIKCFPRARVEYLRNTGPLELD